MNEVAQGPVIYKFGPFRLDPAAPLLTVKGKPISIPPKPLEILILLVQRHGQIVLKDELIKLVWADSFVEEANITQNVFLIRKVLGRDEKGRQYIETIPRRGYRFIGKIREEPYPTLEDDNKHVGRDRVTSKDQPARVEDRFTCSIAVLPLANLSAEPETDYLSDSLTETIINRLSQLPYLRVIARPTVFRYKGPHIIVQDIARELNVENVATGRILVRDGEAHIQIELTDAQHESQSWGKHYNVKLTDLLDVQGKIAEDVLEQLQLQCTAEERKRINKRHTNNGEAHKLYLKGCYHQNHFTEEELKKAIECFQQAIDVDESFALAYSALAECYVLGGVSLSPNGHHPYTESMERYEWLPSVKEVQSRAKAAALKALELDNTLAEAHAVLGFIAYRLEWDWEAAEREYRRAIELSSNFAKGHYWLSLCLRAIGRLDEALAEAKLAHELDPLMFIITVELGRIFYFARYYDQAIKYYREVLELEPTFLPAHFRLGQAYIQKEMYEEAVAELQLAMPPTGDDPEVLASLAYVYAISGRADKAQEVLKKLKELSLKRHVSLYHFAIVYAGLDDKEKALKSLQHAHRDGSGLLIGLKVDPMLDSLRTDARFKELMRRIGLGL
ncbi:MAG TPA: tetratricopeptide repeat protein [Pyrinomonadaceae bacterium]|nr:tetratricopeptide repeat protein [Pyrinomonadaceae bacterium]